MAVKRKKNCSKPNTNRSNKKKSLIIFFTFIIFLFLSVSWKKVTCRFFYVSFSFTFLFRIFFSNRYYLFGCWETFLINIYCLCRIQLATKPNKHVNHHVCYNFISFYKKKRKRIYNISCNLYVRIIFTVFCSSIFNK